MRNFRIFTKLFLSHTAIGLAGVITLSVIFYVILRDSLIQRTIDQLSSINILKKKQIESHFTDARQTLEFFASADNQKDFRDLRTIAEKFDFKQIAIMDSAHNTIVGSDSLAQLVKSKLNVNLDFQVIDLSQAKTRLAYVVKAVKSGHVIYLVGEEKFSRIQQLLLETTGMGNTGESYLIGVDHKMRSISRFMPERDPLSIAVNSKAADNVFSGNSGGAIIHDYRNVKVLSYYRTLNHAELQWAIISEIDFNEAMKPIVQLRNYLLVIVLLLVVVIIIVTFGISNAISKPILSMKNLIGQLSIGVIPERKKFSTTTDEIDAIATAIDQLIVAHKRTADFAYEIGSGNFDAQYTSLSDRDNLGKALIHMRDQLKSLSEKEIRLVREKTAAVLEGQEHERKRIIRELHDGVGQLMTAINLRVGVIEGNGELKEELKSRINETIAEVKRISYNVMPNAILDFGLEAALRGLCENVKKYSGLNFDYRYIKEVDHQLSFDLTITVFRIIQEGLNNIVKHARATRFDLHILDKDDEIYFLLRDDGNGFNENEVAGKNGFGLKSIRERAKLLNGNAEIFPADDKGTIVEVHIPIS